MILVISPAKTLKRLPITFEELKKHFKEPIFKKKTLELVDLLKKKSQLEITKLLGVNQKIGELNYQRFQSFPVRFQYEESYPAIFLYYGDVYKGFEFHNYKLEHFDFLENHVRILSGLYGILKPFSLIYPYRLEMATQFSFTINQTHYHSLYSYWSDIVTNYLNEEIHHTHNQLLVNLASNEYAKAIDKKKLSFPMIQIIFQEKRNGKYTTIALNSKRARGKMVNWIIKNQIQDVEFLKNFHLDHYKFSKEKSTKTEWYFLKG
ncbi:MAG: YaaA family protein [Leptonema sp. (in: bacteria)]